MGLFNKNNGQQMSPRQLLKNRSANGRNNILIVLAFTAINMVLTITGNGTYFLFSAFIPYYLVTNGAVLCGMYPEEFYEEVTGAPYHSMEFYDKSYFVIMLAIAIVILAVYLLCWFFSKKESRRMGWMIGALVFFSLDTLAMIFLGGIAADMIIDYAFHGWVIFSFVSAILAIRKLKAMPEEVIEAVAYEPVPDTTEQLPPEE